METDFKPNPIDTQKVLLAPELLDLMEVLAENTHQQWAARRISDGWAWGPKRDDKKKTHPCLVPYSELPESEKQYDRTTAMEVLKVIVALGYEIGKGK